MEDLGPYDTYEEGVCTGKGEGIPIIKGREGRGARVHTESTKERIYLTLKVASNNTSVLCRKEEQEEADGTGL